mmetsp:Transcript_29199/g.69721  ORF Transcript_29199/g.69721 Transcript_29199/m.69721 type:complete len:207 (-) Transcript_29199:335-955(-)
MGLAIHGGRRRPRVRLARRSRAAPLRAPAPRLPPVALRRLAVKVVPEVTLLPRLQAGFPPRLPGKVLHLCPRPGDLAAVPVELEAVVPHEADAVVHVALVQELVVVHLAHDRPEVHRPLNDLKVLGDAERIRVDGLVEVELSRLLEHYAPENPLDRSLLRQIHTDTDSRQSSQRLARPYSSFENTESFSFLEGGGANPFFPVNSRM